LGEAVSSDYLSYEEADEIVAEFWGETGEDGGPLLLDHGNMLTINGTGQILFRRRRPSDKGRIYGLKEES
jgi:hypothetical protein